MAHLGRSNGRPEPEVIVNFADGLSYNKIKLEEAYRNGLFDKPVKPHKEATPSIKREDVDLIVHEFDLTRPQAEKVLHENGGNIVQALENLINTP